MPCHGTCGKTCVKGLAEDTKAERSGFFRNNYDCVRSNKKEVDEQSAVCLAK